MEGEGSSLIRSERQRYRWQKGCQANSSSGCVYFLRARQFWNFYLFESLVSLRSVEIRSEDPSLSPTHVPLAFSSSDPRVPLAHASLLLVASEPQRPNKKKATATRGHAFRTFSSSLSKTGHVQSISYLGPPPQMHGCSSPRLENKRRDRGAGQPLASQLGFSDKGKRQGARITRRAVLS